MGHDVRLWKLTPKCNDCGWWRSGAERFPFTARPRDSTTSMFRPVHSNWSREHKEMPRRGAHYREQA